jgi:phage tail protein X
VGCNSQLVQTEAAATAAAAANHGQTSAVPGMPATLVFKFPDMNLETHSQLQDSAEEALRDVSLGFDTLSWPMREGACLYIEAYATNVRVVICSSEPTGVPDLLNPKLTSEEREVLSSSTVLASAAFMQQQPALYHTAVKAAKHWVGKECAQVFEARSAQANRKGFTLTGAFMHMHVRMH